MLRARWNSPRGALRLTITIILLGGVVAGIGAWLRDEIPGGNDAWTYFLDTAGLLIAVAGAALDFRASGRLAEFAEGQIRRRGAILLLAGTAAAVTSCLVLGWSDSVSSPFFRGLLTAVLTAGIGFGLAGFMEIGWFRGGDWLERRIGQRVDEDW
jgi:hypothetical protein